MVSIINIILIIYFFVYIDIKKNFIKNIEANKNNLNKDDKNNFNIKRKNIKINTSNDI